MSFGGLDVGTTVARLLVFDEEGREIASAYGEYPLLTEGGYLEVSPERLWSAVCGVCREASAEVTGDPIKSLAVSAMGDSLFVTDGALQPAANVILAFDTRSKDACARLADALGFERWHEATGMPAHSMATATKIAWYLSERQSRNLRFLCAEDFVIGKLTGNPVMSWTTAARTMLFDVGNKRWWRPVLDLIGIDENALSRVEPCASVAGTIARSAVEETGLDIQTRVVTGGHDQICSAIGSGAVRDGIVSDNTGTFECVIAAIAGSRRSAVDRAALAGNNLALYPHGPQGLWAAFAWFNAGSLVTWCRDVFFYGEDREEKGSGVFKRMFAALPEGPGKVWVLPHFTGSGTPWLDSDATGVFTGLNLGTTRREIFKGILEGIGYDLMANLAAMEEAGVPAQRIRASGGGSRSAAWCQLKADMTGKEVTVVDNPEGSALGAAVCAAAAVGIFGSIEEGADRMVTLGKTYTPDGGRHDAYREGFNHYRRLVGLLGRPQR